MTKIFRRLLAVIVAFIMLVPIFTSLAYGILIEPVWFLLIYIVTGKDKGDEILEKHEKLSTWLFDIIAKIAR